MEGDDKYLKLLTRIFRPIARFSIANALKFNGVQQALKMAFIQSAQSDFPIEGKKVTSSRISLLTGLQRRDIGDYVEGAIEYDAQSRLVRVHSHLRAENRARMTIGEFETIARSLYQDIHPRTFLDELLRLDLVTKNGDEIVVKNVSFIENDAFEATKIFTDNVSAHLNVGVSNILGQSPQLEQTVFATSLDENDVRALEDFARTETSKLLNEINARAVKMQKNRHGSHRIRFGYYLERRED